MGANFGRDFARGWAAVTSLGLSELIIALTPDQREQIEEVNAQIKKLEEEKKELEKKMKDMDPKDYEKINEQMRAKYVNNVRKLPPVPKTKKRSVAVVGKCGAGKSTLINKVFNTSCKTSPLRCTDGCDKVYEDNKIDIFDVFGSNDTESYNNMKCLLRIKQLHLIVCVYTEAVEHTYNLAELLDALGTPVLFVRNKCDDFIYESDVLKKVEDNDRTALKKKAPKVFTELHCAAVKKGFRVPEIRKGIYTCKI